MKWNILLLLPALMWTDCRAAEVFLATVFQDNTHQFTGVAISKSGRMFVNYPRWLPEHQYDVVEVMSNGTVSPYPNEEWNGWHEGLSGTNKWVCVQAVYVDDGDELWVVDSGAPEMQNVQGDGSKLVGIDLKNNAVKRLYNLTKIAGSNSYINDVRVDTQTQTAYLTDSKNGGIVVVNLESGERAVLTRHYSVKSDASHTVMVNGEELKINGQPFKGTSDGIALSPDRKWLYYKPLTDTKLYRVRTGDLRNSSLSDDELDAKVEDLGSNFTTSDGMIFDRKGNLYLSDYEHDAIVRITPAMKLEIVAHDQRLIWPDTFSWSSDGWLYVSCSQIQNMPWCHGGQSTRTTPYSIYRLKTQ